MYVLKGVELVSWSALQQERGAEDIAKIRKTCICVNRRPEKSMGNVVSGRTR